MAPSNRTFDNKFLDNVHYVTWGMKDAGIVLKALTT